VYTVAPYDRTEATTALVFVALKISNIAIRRRLFASGIFWQSADQLAHARKERSGLNGSSRFTVTDVCVNDGNTAWLTRYVTLCDSPGSC
jgi:hypothetical protein